MLHANFTALSVMEAVLLPLKFFIAVIGIFYAFAPVTLTLTRWPSYKLDPYSLRIYCMSKSKFSRSSLSKVRQRDRQTDRTGSIGLYHAAVRVITKAGYASKSLIKPGCILLNIYLFDESSRITRHSIFKHENKVRAIWAVAVRAFRVLRTSLNVTDDSLLTNSVVRYPRYLDTYRRYLRDDTSIANVTIYRGIS